MEYLVKDCELFKKNQPKQTKKQKKKKTKKKSKQKETQQKTNKKKPEFSCIQISFLDMRK